MVQTSFKSAGLIGICRIRFPVAAKTAFATAGAIGGTPISPIPGYFVMDVFYSQNLTLLSP
jgi:hypothetical protein